MVSNSYIWPVLAQGGSLVLLGIYGLISWKRIPRLALVSLAAIMLAGMYGAQFWAMGMDPESLIRHHGGLFLSYTTLFYQLFMLSMILNIAGALIRDSKIRTLLFTGALGLIVLGMILYSGGYSRRESIQILSVVLADYGKAGHFPIMIFGWTENLIYGSMIVLPGLVLVGSSKILFERSREWLKLSPWTVLPGLIVFLISIIHFHAIQERVDFSRFYELLHFSFFAVLFSGIVMFQSGLTSENLKYRQLLCGAAMGIAGSAAAQLLNVTLVYEYVINLKSTGSIAFILALIFIIQIYDKLTTKFASEIRISQQERLAAIGRLASVTAHEIRNPLQAIRSLSQFIAARAKGGDLEEPAEVIMNETDRLDRILQRLLDFAREMKLNLKQVDLPGWWNEVKGLSAEFTRDKDIALEWDDPPDISATFDPERIRQVFLNVFKNAVEACGEEGTVGADIEASAKKIIIRVRDTGKGISNEDMEKVFREFYTTKASGSGLGLPISKRIIESHGGRIYFNTGVTEGTEVVVELPVEPPKAVLRRYGNE